MSENQPNKHYWACTNRSHAVGETGHQAIAQTLKNHAKIDDFPAVDIKLYSIPGEIDAEVNNGWATPQATGGRFMGSLNIGDWPE